MSKRDTIVAEIDDGIIECVQAVDEPPSAFFTRAAMEARGVIQKFWGGDAPPSRPQTENTIKSVHPLSRPPQDSGDDNNNTPKPHRQGDKGYQLSHKQRRDIDSSEDDYKLDAILEYLRKRTEDRRERNGNSSDDDYKPDPVLDHPRGQATWAKL